MGKTSGGKPRRGRKPRPHDPVAIAAKLDEIEAELRRIGYWSPDSARPADNDYSRSPLQVWLQFVLLPEAREATERRQWPESSGVGLLALRTWDYFEHVPEAQALVSLLNEFDRLIEHPEHFAIGAAKRKASEE